MLKKLIQIWQTPDLRKNILFVLALLAIFRLAAHIPIPGVDVSALKDFFNSNQILGLINIFSGGAMENFSIVALGVGPYITASIIFQLLIMIIPRLEELSKEGERGHQRINQYTRLLAVPMALVQGYGMLAVLQRSGTNIITGLSSQQLVITIITLMAGTIFLMWLGELISEKKVGNGISLIIFAGIVSGIPGAVQRTLATFDPSQLINLLIFMGIGLVTIIGVVIITEAQRHVPIAYAKQVRGNRLYGGFSTYLPLRVNQVGMIPIIFAISIILFPTMIAQFLAQAKSVWLVQFAQWVLSVFANQLIYGILYFLLVFGFTYFYTAVVFHPQQIADNLQKQGGFIPGIRPGSQTAQFLQNISGRIILAGALFLGLIAVLPNIVQAGTGVQTLVVGGASLLIVVSVVIETVRQVDSQLTMRDYEGI
ncbi:MAG: preprotein translocase subunit SecY [bacterium]